MALEQLWVTLLAANLKDLALRAHQSFTPACAAVPINPQGTDNVGQEKRVLVERNDGVSLPALARERYREAKYHL